MCIFSVFVGVGGRRGGKVCFSTPTLPSIGLSDYQSFTQ